MTYLTLCGQKYFFLVLVVKFSSLSLQLRRNTELTLLDEVKLTVKTPSKTKRSYQ